MSLLNRCLEGTQSEDRKKKTEMKMKHDVLLETDSICWTLKMSVLEKMHSKVMFWIWVCWILYIPMGKLTIVRWSPKQCWWISMINWKSILTVGSLVDRKMVKEGERSISWSPRVMSTRPPVLRSSRFNTGFKIGS